MDCCSNLYYDSLTKDTSFAPDLTSTFDIPSRSVHTQYFGAIEMRFLILSKTLWHEKHVEHVEHMQLMPLTPPPPPRREQFYVCLTV